MSLGDLGKNINASGKDLYAQNRARILREGEEKKKMEERRTADINNREIMNLKRDKLTLDGRVMQLRRDIEREKDSRGKSLKETELKKLISEKVSVEGKLMAAERKGRNLGGSMGGLRY